VTALTALPALTTLSALTPPNPPNPPTDGLTSELSAFIHRAFARLFTSIRGGAADNGVIHVIDTVLIPR